LIPRPVRRALVLIAFIVPTIAQAQPAADSVLQRMRSIGLDSSQLPPLAGVLLDSIGPRLTGSPALAAAQRWLVRTYRGWGIDAWNERYGTWRGWRRGVSHVDLVSPRVRSLDAMMVAYSPGTGGRPRTAGVVILPHFDDSTQFVRWLPRARGKLVLVSAPFESCRPSSEWAQEGTAEERARHDSTRLALLREWGTRDVRGTGYSMSLGGGELGLRLERAGAAGLLTSRPKDAWGTREIFETYNRRAPVLSLGCEDYGLVFRLAERDRHPRLRFVLESERLGEQPVFNTLAIIPGGEKRDEYVMLSAHLDSWDGGSGATDNGAGSLVMLEAMRILQRAYPHPRRTILVGHWSGEEVGLRGSRAFVEDHPDVVRHVHALINHDNGTGRVTKLTALGIPDAADHLRDWLAKLPAPLRGQVEFGGLGLPSTGGTDDFAFNCAGVPIFGTGAVSWDYGPYTWHTERDTYDKLVFGDLAQKATVTAMLVSLASEDATTIDRARIDVAWLAARGRLGPHAPPSLTDWPSCGAPSPRRTVPRLK
jgi:hypothetical protein